MPRKTKIVTQTIEDDPENPAVEDTEKEDLTDEEMEAEATQAQIDQIVRNMDGTGGTVAVYRKAPRGLTFDYTERMSIEDFTANGMEEIKRRYGGGTYRLRFADQQSKYRGQATCSVDARVKGELDQPAAMAPASDGRAVEALTSEISRQKSDFGSIMLQMMQMQQQQAQQTLQILTAAMAQPKPQPMKEIAGMLAPFIPLAVKLIEGRATDSSLKAIETIAKVKDLFGGDGGGGDGGGTIEKLLTSLAPSIVAKLQAAQAPVPAPQDQPQNVVSLPNPQLPAPEAAQSQIEDPEMFRMMVIRAIRGSYPRLLKAAQKGTEPQSYFDTIMDDLEDQPGPVLDAFIAILCKDDWASVLFAVDPLPELEWFEKLRQEFLAWAKENEQQAAADAAELAKPVALREAEQPPKKAANDKK